MKVSPVVIAVLIGSAVIVGLVVLFHIAERNRRLGRSIAKVCAVVSSVLVSISYRVEKAALSCHRVCETALKSINDTGEWTMGEFLEKLEDFAVGFLVIVGEAIQVTEVLPSLFQAAQVSLPPILELSSAALFILTSIMFAEVVFNAWRGVGLFRGKGKLSRWFVGLLTLLLWAFSCVVNFYFYIYRAKILAHQPTTGMTLYIMGGLGLEVSAVAPFCYLAVKEGSPAVVALLMSFAEKTFQTVHAAATLIPDLLDTQALHLSNGEIGVYGKQIERKPHEYPELFGKSPALLPGHTHIVELPEQAVSIDTDTDNVQVFPVLTPELEEKMSQNPDCNAAIVLIGGYGTRMLHPTAQAIERLHATSIILSSFYLDLETTIVQTALSADIMDKSPTPAQRKAMLLHSDTMGQAYHTLLTSGVDNIIETHLVTKAFPAPLIFIVDCNHIVDTIDMIEAVNRRLPLHPIVVVIELSAHDVLKKDVQTGISDLQALHREDSIQTIIVSDPYSSFAAQYGQETQHHFLAQTLIALLVAHKHSSHNRSFGNILHDLHSLSPFTAVSFASETVTIGKLPKRWKFVPGVAGIAGTGSYGDILAQARVAIDRVMTEEDTRSFPAQVKSDAFCAVLSSVPVALNDSRLEMGRRDNALYCSSHYPFAISTTVSANGYPYPHQSQLGSRFMVMASCLYPLQPASLLQIQEGKRVKVTPLFPVTALERINGNGNVPTFEQTPEPKKTKVATTTRRKKTSTTTRRVARN